MAKTDTYNETVVIRHPNAIVRVHFPDISDEENRRRYEFVKDAARALMQSLYERRGDRI